jgi:hypothetical protein
MTTRISDVGSKLEPLKYSLQTVGAYVLGEYASVLNMGSKRGFLLKHK